MFTSTTDRLALLKHIYTDGADTFELYDAGLPSFPRNFTRDSIISAIVLKDKNMLLEQLRFCAIKQGQKADSFTGEEPGKIFHEFPGYDMNGFNTMYNACDANSLFLLGWHYFLEFGGDFATVSSHHSYITKAAEYIMRHIENNLFIEDPKFSGSGRYALKVTYWKDSSLMHRISGQPTYPVTYILSHVQAIAGLRSARRILHTDEFTPGIDSLLLGLHSMYDKEQKQFAIIRDGDGDIYLDSDDLFHGLFFLEPKDLTKAELQSIRDSLPLLNTPFGVRTNSIEYCDINDSYHSCALWPFEQAIIYMGAKKFGLSEVMDVAQRIYAYIDTNPEYLHLYDEVTFEKRGCDPQLWTIACKSFFEKELCIDQSSQVQVS